MTTPLIPATETIFRTLTPIGSSERQPIDYPVAYLPDRLRRTVEAICVRADCHPTTAAWGVIGAASASPKPLPSPNCSAAKATKRRSRCTPI